MTILTGPALAWEARFGAVCELIYEGEPATVRVIYDPAVPEYSISVTTSDPWGDSPIFGMRFDGPRQSLITTDRHVRSDGGATVTVTDRGFGNVLDGLEFNAVATALLGNQAVSVPLEGAAPAVREFRACASGVGV
ncbi:MAG: hypothetical protein AAFO77_08025 [Pseudomonadota bacterium]